MTKSELKEKALSLPLSPGVYLMQNKAGEVIYVGKAKKLKNRVSQYFIDSASHSPKTRLMVSKVDHFDVIMAASEFEALVLECSLIKRYMPKYNILLKDDKGFPYLRLNLTAPYPVMTLASKVMEDGARYFGPYGGRYLTQKVIDTLRLTFKLPGCGKVFPRDIGKERPCLNFQMGNCDGWCRGTPDQAEYRERISQVEHLLCGQYKPVAAILREKMLAASETLEFEKAAQLRDRMNAIEALGQKQLVTAGRMADTDAIGYAQTEAKGCFAVLHYVDGNLVDKDYEILPLADDPAEAVSALLKQYYFSRGAAPKQILLPMEIEDAELFAELLSKNLNKHIRIRTPQRGDGTRLVEAAQRNALEEAQRITTREEKLRGTQELLRQMLKLEHQPRRMESYDISNISGTDIVASMVVFEDGKPLRSGYRHFKLEGLDDQDDYASMRQVLHRRFKHFLAGDKGFESAPDLLLIDGGVNHAKAVLDELQPMGIQIPIFGMVKDDRHRTRALVTPAGEEIGISGQQSVFALIGTIQEETHRFAITYHRKLRSKRVKGSSLEQIPGIGAKRREDLLKRFHTVSAIRAASVQELGSVLPRDAAVAVYQYFHGEEET
ncbi:MAG: excinuclease ABC subunit UvrC [Oscillospiraceae bacterium]|nr:excinuclease ABC subunit UvrC [Oscillospiraceae bacterium]